MAFTTAVTGTTAEAETVNQIIQALDGTAGKGQAIALTQLNDPNAYALDIRQLDATYGYILRLRDEVNNAVATFTRSLITLAKSVNATAGINVGTATGAGTGDVLASGDIRAGGGVQVGSSTTDPPTGAIGMSEISKPSAPGTDKVWVYAKDDSGTTKVYYQRSDGTEIEMGSTEHAAATTQVHGLGSGVYLVGCKMGMKRIEYAQGTTSGTGILTITISWPNAFSSIGTCLVWIYPLEEVYVLSYSTTGATQQFLWTGGSQTIYGNFLGIGA